MARVTIPPVSAPGAYAYLGAPAAWTAAVPSSKNQFLATNHELLLVRNAGAVSHSITITSADDPFNRTRDVSETISAGATRIYGPFRVTGWKQIDGYVYLEADSAEIQFLVVTLP